MAKDVATENKVVLAFFHQKLIYIFASFLVVENKKKTPKDYVIPVVRPFILHRFSGANLINEPIRRNDHISSPCMSHFLSNQLHVHATNALAPRCYMVINLGYFIFPLDAYHFGMEGVDVFDFTLQPILANNGCCYVTQIQYSQDLCATSVSPISIHFID
jgi:hypothetical protein